MTMYVYLCEYAYVFVYVYVPTYVHRCVCMICLYDMYNISAITFCTRGITIYSYYSNVISWISKFIKWSFWESNLDQFRFRFWNFIHMQFVKLSHIPHHFLLDQCQHDPTVEYGWYNPILEHLNFYSKEKFHNMNTFRF